MNEARITAAIGMELGRKPMDEMRWEEIWDAALRIRAMFLSHPLSDRLRETLADGLRSFDSSAPLAVRSSAIGEDSAGAALRVCMSQSSACAVFLPSKTQCDWFGHRSGPTQPCSIARNWGLTRHTVAWRCWSRRWSMLTARVSPSPVIRGHQQGSRHHRVGSRPVQSAGRRRDGPRSLGS